MLDPVVRLRNSIINDELSIVKMILRRYPDLLYCIDSSNGWSLLHYASFHGRYLICVHLIQLRCERDEIRTTFLNNTAVHLALINGDEQTIHLLLQHFPLCINMKGQDGYTPIHFCCRYNYYQVLSLLISCGAKLDLPDDKHGDYPLHVAIKYGNLDVAKILIQNGQQDSIYNKMHMKPSDVGYSFEIIKQYLKLLKEEETRETQLIKINTNITTTSLNTMGTAHSYMSNNKNNNKNNHSIGSKTPNLKSDGAGTLISNNPNDYGSTSRLAKPVKATAHLKSASKLSNLQIHPISTKNNSTNVSNTSSGDEIEVMVNNTPVIVPPSAIIQTSSDNANYGGYSSNNGKPSNNTNGIQIRTMSPSPIVINTPNNMNNARRFPSSVSFLDTPNTSSSFDIQNEKENGHSFGSPLELKKTGDLQSKSSMNFLRSNDTPKSTLEHDEELKSLKSTPHSPSFSDLGDESSCNIVAKKDSQDIDSRKKSSILLNVPIAKVREHL